MKNVYRTLTLFLALLALATQSATAGLYVMGEAPLGKGWTLSSDYYVEVPEPNSNGIFKGYFTGTGATSYFVFSDQNSCTDWTEFNNNYRYSPADENLEMVAGTEYTVSKSTNGSAAYYFTHTAGTVYQIYGDWTSGELKVTIKEATAKTYNIYVKNESDVSALNLYVWDATGELSASWVGDALSETEEINGATWYKKTYTSYCDNIYCIVNEGSGAPQTADIYDPYANFYIVYNGNGNYTSSSQPNTEYKLWMHGSLSWNGESCDYSPETGAGMKYDSENDYYYANNVTLYSGSTFCFSTNLGSNWSDAGTRYGYTGSSALIISDEMIGTELGLGAWNESEYQMATAGHYNVLVNLTKGWVKLIKVSESTLSPMNVYLEQTSNVEIEDVGSEGDVYDSSIGEADHWPLMAWNRNEGDWNSGDTRYHYPVTYMGTTTTDDGKTWWHWQVSASIAELKFYRTNKSDNLSETLNRKAGLAYYTWDEDGTTDGTLTDHTRQYFEGSVETVPSNSTLWEGYYYCYFVNTVGWENVFCYAWNDDGSYTDYKGNDMSTWPGVICQCVGTDPETGYEVWLYVFGKIGEIDPPDYIIFNDGNPDPEDDSKEQTGDFVFQNGGVYDYLGLITGKYTLGNIIREGELNVAYTISNDLLGVYYDSDAETVIGDQTIKGALYAKDFNDYAEKSIMSDASWTDYVYDICTLTDVNNFPGGSQIQKKRTAYDQSNWVKLVISPNYSGTVPNLAEWVGKIIPGATLNGYLTDSINPQFHVLSIGMGDSQDYEPNVYITTHFNDTVVFEYTHQDWQPAPYEDNIGRITGKPYHMFYVAPKPQEFAYITWAVYSRNDNIMTGPDYEGEEPSDGGYFLIPAFAQDRETRTADADIYGIFDNAYGQTGGFKVNWSLFETADAASGDGKGALSEGKPWYQIVTPGEMYKFKAIVRYAKDNADNILYKSGIREGDGGVTGGPHRANALTVEGLWYDGIDESNAAATSKFIVFPVDATAVTDADFGKVSSIADITANGDVVSVRYYDLMGVESATPFDGINIVVTTYSDGSRTATKVLR